MTGKQPGWCPVHLLLQGRDVCLELVLHVCKAAVLSLVCFESILSLTQLDLKLTELLLLGIYLQHCLPENHSITT